MKRIAAFALPLLSLAMNASAQATAPATAMALPEGPLQITVTGVEGLVQVRSTEDQPWQKVTVGMQLAEGAEFRTGPKSAVRFSISDDQVFTLDRLGVVKILKANLLSGKVTTDLGMKYGRTRYDVESAERQHDTQVRSPSSVLAVRGTRVSITDQPPFPPRAVSLEGRAFFRDAKKQVNLGGVGKTVVDQDSDTPAQYASGQATTDPRGSFSGRSDMDQLLQQSLAAYGGSDFSNLGVLAFLDAARAGNFTGSVIGALPVGRQLLFTMFWTDNPESSTDVNLAVISPLGERVALGTPLSASGGHFLGADGTGNNGISNQTGVGQESIAWPISFPPGTYQYEINLDSGVSADVTLAVSEIDQSQPDTGTQVLPVQNVAVGPNNPTITGSVTTPLPASQPPRGGQAITKGNTPVSPVQKPAAVRVSKQKDRVLRAPAARIK